MKPPEVLKFKDTWIFLTKFWRNSWKLIANSRSISHNFDIFLVVINAYFKNYRRVSIGFNVGFNIRARFIDSTRSKKEYRILNYKYPNFVGSFNFTIYKNLPNMKAALVPHGPIVFYSYRTGYTLTLKLMKLKLNGNSLEYFSILFCDEKS